VGPNFAARLVFGLSSATAGDIDGPAPMPISAVFIKALRRAAAM
jgi:hypothetical protein